MHWPGSIDTVVDTVRYVLKRVETVKPPSELVNAMPMVREVVGHQNEDNRARRNVNMAMNRPIESDQAELSSFVASNRLNSMV
ncbi:hypothetical protein E5D57_008534 [Metarhizium anisopliae]|nr:hypothetical protein E5D57_008534 [Metarhizium anisopliae]